MIAERRRAALGLAAIMSGLLVLCGWLLVDSVAVFRTALRTSAPSIRIDSGDAAMAVLLPALIGFTIVSFVSVFRAADAGMPSRWWGIVLIVALVSLPLALAAPWVYRSWAEGVVTGRGYVRCEDRGRPSRFPSATFARAPSLCGSSEAEKTTRDSP